MEFLDIITIMFLDNLNKRSSNSHTMCAVFTTLPFRIHRRVGVFIELQVWDKLVSEVTIINERDYSDGRGLSPCMLQHQTFLSVCL